MTLLNDCRKHIVGRKSFSVLTNSFMLHFLIVAYITVDVFDISLKIENRLTVEK